MPYLFEYRLPGVEYWSGFHIDGVSLKVGRNKGHGNTYYFEFQSVMAAALLGPGTLVRILMPWTNHYELCAAWMRDRTGKNWIELFQANSTKSVETIFIREA